MANMEIEKALDQLSTIHDHLSRTEVYRGLRAGPIALTGVLALLTAAVQPLVVSGNNPVGFVYLWTGLAGICAALCGGVIIYQRRHQFSLFDRQKTRKAAFQFLPGLVAGALVTVIFLKRMESAIIYLPGIWALFFSLSIFASRPLLPRNMGWAGMVFLMAGGVLLLFAPSGKSLTPWGMGLTFGLGQLFIAWVLYRDLAREGEKNGL